MSTTHLVLLSILGGIILVNLCIVLVLWNYTRNTNREERRED